MNLKKLMAVLAVLALVLTACDAGGGGDETTPTTAVTPDDGTTTETTAGGTDTGAQTGGSRLDEIIARGTLNCGVNETLPGFGSKDETGAFVGFDIDLCRAVAAAVLGDSEAVNYTALTAAQRFEALSSGSIDMLSRNTTWTQSRDGELGVDFAPTTYYDGQQVMALAADGFDSGSGLADLAGAVICTNAGTTTEKNITEAMQAAGTDFTLTTFEDFNIVLENFKSGACDAVTTDGSGLISRKSTDEPAPGDWVIFPAVPISKEPLGPGVAQGDAKWADAVNWSIYAMILAEELGVDSSNVDAMQASPPNGEVQRLLGGEEEKQTAMGLSADAFYNVIKQVGNYGEIFDRHLTVLGLERGLNALWSDGGLIYAPPAR
ncbi:MAG: amino acid ABC transporter substrate-binding protein [Acidimicrobiia bacterium]|nr:amino acid ABC transporter substrate-binding protein [Acidimicrobiia bacterium]